MSGKVVGQWSEVFSLSNVAAHASLLPNGKVLYWGRRTNPLGATKENGQASPTMDEHWTNAFCWDPRTRESIPTANQPPGVPNGTTRLGNQDKRVNLFCGGHCFLADGRLLAVGGHWVDSVGLDQACVYDYKSNSFTALPAMNKGRWYPVSSIPRWRTAISVPDTCDGKISRFVVSSLLLTTNEDC